MTDSDELPARSAHHQCADTATACEFERVDGNGEGPYHFVEFVEFLRAKHQMSIQDALDHMSRAGIPVSKPTYARWKKHVEAESATGR